MVYTLMGTSVCSVSPDSELSADKTSTASQLGTFLLPYHTGMDLACPDPLLSYDGARTPLTEYNLTTFSKTFTYVGACPVFLAFPAWPTLHLGS